MLVPTVCSRAAADSSPPSSCARADIASPQYCSVSTRVPSMSNSTACSRAAFAPLVSGVPIASTVRRGRGPGPSPRGLPT